MARIRANNASGGGGGAPYAEGTVDTGTTIQDTGIITTDVNTGVAFKPKTIMYNTKTTGKQYYVQVVYDEDDITLAGEGKYMWWGTNATTFQKLSLGGLTDGRGGLMTINNNGFTVKNGSSGYGNMLTYKAWG